MNPGEIIAIIMALRLSRASQPDAAALEREAVLAARILAYAQEKGTPVWGDLRKQMREEQATEEKRRLARSGAG